MMKQTNVGVILSSEFAAFFGAKRSFSEKKSEIDAGPVR